MKTKKDNVYQYGKFVGLGVLFVANMVLALWNVGSVVFALVNIVVLTSVISHYVNTVITGREEALIKVTELAPVSNDNIHMIDNVRNLDCDQLSLELAIAELQKQGKIRLYNQMYNSYGHAELVQVVYKNPFEVNFVSKYDGKIIPVEYLTLRVGI